MLTNNRPNRLITEKSPYLLQHAYNPVDWYPWGDEAFEKAKRENKPVLISIGYSTCHWCHVMAHESFENMDTARIINEHYVAIKVDREERPDIDAVYMTVCQALTGHGGWPLNVFITPDQKPFYAGTYFPKTSMGGIPSFKDVLLSLSKQYQEDPQKIQDVGLSIVEGLSQQSANEKKLTKDIFNETFEQFLGSFDTSYGGFGSEPKFPSPHQLTFLLRYFHWTKNESALKMVTNTLHSMAKGGIRDHIGGGFARYSVDKKWLVPHFEKMLYDQALIVLSFMEAYVLTKDPIFKEVVYDTIRYVERELLDDKGGFYCAEDADSEGVEGKYYVWSPLEILDVLGDTLGEVFCAAYDITEEGNFEGKSIPNQINVNLDEVMDTFELSEEEMTNRFNEAKEILLSHRNKRIHPHKDDKILTSWNALMIVALAKAGQIFEDEHFINLAEDAFDFIESTLTKDGELMARYRLGEIKHHAYLDDYAFLAWACDSLYDATYRMPYLEKMRHYVDKMIKKFEDKEKGGFYLKSVSMPDLILKTKEVYDGAIPSGNSVACYVLYRLSRRLGNTIYEQHMSRAIQAFSDQVASYPMGYSYFLSSILQPYAEPKELVIVEGESRQIKNNELKLGQLFLPNVVVISGTEEELTRLNSDYQAYKAISDRTTYYLCQNYQCQAPTNDVNKIITQL
ncbi:thioredoxin domain-containing protein [Terrilactibacillus laevilacticus]|uniref:thioredoxin domain-containing protein n=1 Tax=Terrilactibacillus laevilacticus TaxID=1380157 RepID=UPI001146EC92|nr:thioredoxin domain-containing protein [Terrilactibacillus laevilacticus]